MITNTDSEGGRPREGEERGKHKKQISKFFDGMAGLKKTSGGCNSGARAGKNYKGHMAHLQSHLQKKPLRIPVLMLY